MIERPTGSITRVKGIENFAGKVVVAEFIKPFGIIFTNHPQLFALGFADQWIIRACLRGEVVAGIAAHFVEVDKHQRQVFE
ncbi:MAG: Uncharacterised protein [Pseudidiomarina mangrovi]|nr:MAG: Uncharacterised protein [Pseudidiomarina mangrovi]